MIAGAVIAEIATLVGTKMCIRRLRNMNMGQRQPSLKLLHYALNRKRTRHHLAV